MKIKKFTGKITKIIDLSPTAKEVIIRTSVPVDFIPGSFLNVFIIPLIVITAILQIATAVYYYIDR